MRGVLDTAGERVAVESELAWVWDLIAEGSAGRLRSVHVEDPSLTVSVEATREPFDVRGWPLLTRGAWARDGEVVMRSACTSGFDLHLKTNPGRADFRFRWRPPPRDRAATSATGGQPGPTSLPAASVAANGQ